MQYNKLFLINNTDENWCDSKFLGTKTIIQWHRILILPEMKRKWHNVYI